MAEYDPTDSNPDLARAFKKEGISKLDKNVEVEPAYRIDFKTRIAVSKHQGHLWHSKIEQSKCLGDTSREAWSEAIRYYEHDQQSNRTTSGDNSSGSRPGRRLNNQWTETENLVFINATTLLPMLYAKNPNTEVTATNQEAGKDWATAGELLINNLFSQEVSPGINLKPKIKRLILWTLLTNNGWIKVGWSKKEDSSEQALQDLEKLSKSLANAKSKKEIEEIEGKLIALEESISLLGPSGPIVKVVNPFRLYVDPNAEPDLSNANWVAEEDYLPTSYINAVYGKDSNGKVVSVYEPTHIITASKEKRDIEEDINNFSIFQEQDKDKDAKHYGYNNASAFEKAKYTKVWWIWDKVTRRVFLYTDNKWNWPLWVWDDPLKLQRFFPYRHLWFHEQVEGTSPKGEVTYYLDQQDGINDNNATLAIARNWAKNHIVYDKNAGITTKLIEDLLRGPDGNALGVDVPDGKSLKDILQTVVPPAMNYPDLFNNERLYATINKITGISSAMQGSQFKTNTTNDAINFYQKNVDIRVDEKIDQIEDLIGGIGWDLLQLCAQYWTIEEVSEIIGNNNAIGWKQIQDFKELATSLRLRVVGGSTDKPTSKMKKQQALEIGQVLGQFSGGVPAVGIIILRIMERAFSDEIVITQEDWKMIFESMNMALNAAGAGPGGTGGPQQQQQQSATGNQQADEMRAQIADLIKNLPDELKAKLQQMIDEGVDPKQALQEIQQLASNSKPQQQQQQIQ
jgi:hypothetical protein